MHLVQRRAREFGVRGIDAESLRFDLRAAVNRKNEIVGDILAGIHKRLGGNNSIDFLRGRAEFTSPVDIEVDGRRIRADKTILAVGARALDPQIPGLDAVGYLTNREALDLESLPASMIVIGAGYIGVEFAQMYARFGTKVTLLGRAPRLMRHEEPEMSETLATILAAENVEIHTSATVLRAGTEDALPFVDARVGETDQRFHADAILVATGRIARTDGLGLEAAGVEMSGSFVRVDASLQTTADNISSLGDANGGAMFTHRATYDGPIAALNAVKQIGRSVDYRVVPRAVFTEPDLASVGLGEREAHASGRDVTIGTARFEDSARAKAIGQTEGLVKIVADAASGEILGAHLLGPHADILIHEIVAVMHSRGTLDAIAKSIHIHPTLSEVVKAAAKAAR